MKLIDVVRPECIRAGAEIADKKALLREVARLAAQCAALKAVTEATILEGIERREQLGSTGFGRGIAIPHCRLQGIEEFVVGLITVPSSVDFEALDDAPVKVVAFIIGPDEDPNRHIRLLSSVSQTFSIPGAVEELVAQRSPEALRESFLRFTRGEVEDQSKAQRSLLHVFIQDESIFHEIIQLLTATRTTSLTVLDTENIGAYLTRMPLFSGFWTDNPKQFSRMILTVVDKRLVNETIRRVESITGDLDKANNILLTVQDLAYAVGSLDA